MPHLATSDPNGSVLNYQRRTVNDWDIGFMFNTDTHAVYLREQDRRYLPAGYIPRFNIENEPVQIEPEINHEELDDQFVNEILHGKWIQLQDDDPMLLKINGKNIDWNTMHESGSFTFSYYRAWHNLIRSIYLNAYIRGFPQLEYRIKKINGEYIQMMFGLDDLPGAPVPELRSVFVKVEDLERIPPGYQIDRYDDDVYVYIAPVKKQKLYFSEERSECLSWLGKNPAEINVFPSSVEDGYLKLTGYLLGKKIRGSAQVTDKISCVDLYSYEIDFEMLTAYYTRLYGNPEDSFIPYVSSNGGAHYIRTFDTGNCKIIIDMSTLNEWICITFTLK